MRATIFLVKHFVPVMLFFFAIFPLSAWYEHPLLLYPVLASIPEVAKADPVRAKSLEGFILDNEEALEQFLLEEELRFIDTLDPYPPLPDLLRFHANGDGSNSRKRFLRALRLRPGTPFYLYLHLLPGMLGDMENDPPYSQDRVIVPGLISTFTDTAFMEESTYIAIEDGEKVSPLMVLLTGSDEPDYGADTGLFEDNDTPFGAEYGFGEQPFGNPNLEYGSQAPFHMGFYHESKLLYLFGPFLKRTYPEYRIAQFTGLARFAFNRGEDYWGWRFLGWALHYLGDISMPYHTAPLPGVGTAKIIWMNLKSVLGFPKGADDAVQIVSNRHTVFEQFQWIEARKIYLAGDWSHPVVEALADPVPREAWSETFVRDVAAASSVALAKKVDEALLTALPPQLVDDPSFEVYGTQELAELDKAVSRASGQEGRQLLLDALSETLRNFSMHMRVLISELAPKM